jgi:hypothetical protein
MAGSEALTGVVVNTLPGPHRLQGISGLDVMRRAAVDTGLHASCDLPASLTRGGPGLSSRYARALPLFSAGVCRRVWARLQGERISATANR